MRKFVKLQILNFETTTGIRIFWVPYHDQDWNSLSLNFKTKAKSGVILVWVARTRIRFSESKCENKEQGLISLREPSKENYESLDICPNSR